MSGDVQPRKRKDKKRKKDELGVDEAPRGTAAALGEGDVFMHSPNEHGTGGHWCAKIIFFSLLAVLITLIGLIILENRGLSELEANSVESRYSGVLEGWLEDAPDDDHHDEHTLELKHHDDDEEDHDDHSPEEIDHDDEDDDDDDHSPEEIDHDDEDDDDEADDHDDEDDDHDEEDDEHDDENDERGDEDDDHDDNDEEASLEHDDDEVNEQESVDHDDDQDKDEEEFGDHNNSDDEDDGDNDELDQQNDDNSEERGFDKSNEDDDNIEQGYSKYDESGEDEKNNDNDDDDDDLQKVDENDTAEDDDQNEERNDSTERNDDEDDSDENDQGETRENEDDEEEHEEENEDLEVEVERLEKEVSDEDALTEELPTAEAEEDDKSEEISSEVPHEDDADADDGVGEDEEFLEPDDIDDALPDVEPIVAPKGKPLVEVEEETPIVKPADTLAEEEEYEKQQEELRREQEQASHMWLKLAVGGALLLATHAVVRRATAPRDDTSASDEHDIREETPVIDRRMTLISEEAASVPSDEVEEISQPVVEEKIVEKLTSVIKSAPPHKEESEEEGVEEEENEDEIQIEAKDVTAKETTKDKELYSDEEEEEEVEEEEEIVEEVKEPPKKIAPTPQKAIESKPVADEDVPDDVEIIDNEQLEEELEEEDDEEEDISDVDDAELLSRLEAKYGRLPEPERYGPKPKDGGNSIVDDWPGEPSDQYWRQQLDQAEEELRQGAWGAAGERAGAAALAGSARARWLQARAADAEAEARRDNRLLSRAITAYLHLLKMNERLPDHRLLEVAHRTLDRIRFRGNYLSAEPVYRLLIRRFPDVPDYHNNLTVSFLMANRADLAEQVIKDTLKKWPNDRVALAHLGFILKTQHNRNEEAVEAFQKALEGDIGPATEPRFYYHLGDSLLLLGRFSEAHEVHKRGAALGHFLSPAQRSLYNVERLKSQPWWNIEQTPYAKLARALEKSWKEILKEGEAAKALYEKEKEGLKERGEWSQLDLFVRGQEIPNRCKRAPVTCSIVRSEAAAAGCRRGQVKFSAMEAGTHVRPHVGPTNCRLRMHLGLSNTKDTYLRVHQETRQWQVGKTFMFDDSFEHEVWHNGTGTRLVLIVDVWHPALTPAERRTLPPI